MEKAKIADRVRRMLEKAKAEGSTEAEAIAFTEKAQALMLEHELSLVDVQETTNQPKEEIEADSMLETDPQPWRRRLGRACAELFMCRYFYDTFSRDNEKGTKYDQHTFVGKRGNITVAKVMFSYLIETVDQLARKGALAVPKNERSPYRVAFRTQASIRIGNRIGKRVDEAKQGGVIKTEAGNTLPALRDQYEQASSAAANFIKQVLDVELTLPVRKHVDPLTLHRRGAVEGDAAGREIGLDQQLNRTQTKQLGNS